MKGRDNQIIEYLRIVAAFGIVCYHGEVPASNLAYAGLIFFLALSPYLVLKVEPAANRGIETLARSLMWPWAFWMVVYGIMYVGIGQALFRTEGLLNGVLYGTSSHLWFLPAMFAALVVLTALNRSVAPQPLFWLFLLAAVALLLLSPVLRPVISDWHPPYAQWLHAAAPVCAGAALGLAARLPRLRPVAFIGLAAALGICFFQQIPGMSTPYLVGVLALMAAIWFGDRFPPCSPALLSASKCMMGVYLAHMVGLGVFNRLIGKGSYLTATLAFATVFVVIWWARSRYPRVRVLTG